MKTWKNNGECWYCDERSLWKRARQWFLWVGGWEKANGKGWEPFVGEPGMRRLRSLAPVSIIGGRATYYGWGVEARLRRGYFVLTWRPSRKAYLSRNGTPHEAHVWFWNPPHEVTGK